MTEQEGRFKLRLNRKLVTSKVVHGKYKYLQKNYHRDVFYGIWIKKTKCTRKISHRIFLRMTLTRLLLPKKLRALMMFDRPSLKIRKVQ